MIRISSAFIAAIAIIGASYASGAGANDGKTSTDTLPKCTSFLTGKWAGEGTVTGFGSPVQLSSTASYKSDGTFTSTSRYLGQDKKWTEQTTTGTWSIEASPSPKVCFLHMNSQTAVATANSSTEIEIIDADTYRAFGLDLKRVR